MGVLRFSKWQKPCEDAFLEPDPDKLLRQVFLAETAIFHRLLEAAGPPGNIELQTMDVALGNLQCLLESTFVFTVGEGPQKPDDGLTPDTANSISA